MGTRRMPDGVMEQWERIIRKVATFDFKGKEQPMELTFSLEAHGKLCQWKESVNNAIYHLRNNSVADRYSAPVEENWNECQSDRPSD